MRALGTIASLFSGSEKRSVALLLGAMVIAMILETLGVGIVLPVLAVVSQSDLANRYPAVAPWLARLGNPGPERLMVYGMALVVGVYAFKTAYLAYVAWLQARFAFAFQAGLSRRLFETYLMQPYAFHLQRNSAHLIRHTIGQVDEVRGVMQLALGLVADTLVTAGIAALLLIVEPVGTAIAVATFGIIGWLFHRFTAERIQHWGAARQVHEAVRLQHLQQGLGGVKDIRLLGREAEFLSRYDVENVGTAKLGAHQTTLLAMPRLWLELLGVLALAVLVVVMVSRGRPVPELLPTVALFAAAAFRLMPAVTRMLNAIQSVRASTPAIENIGAELKLSLPQSAKAKRAMSPLQREFALEDVQLTYDGATAPALQGVTFSVAKGSCVGIIGKTGGGKSTLVDVMLGLLTPERGRVTVDGRDIQPNVRDWQDQIGYVPQTIFLTDDSLRMNVAFGIPSAEIDDSAVWRALRAAHLDDFARTLPNGLETSVGERGVRLSGGQRQRIGIARALYHDPAVIVLDEATSALDTVTERGVMDAVAELQGRKTIVIVAHRLTTVERCDWLIRLDAGRVVAQGVPSAVLVPGATLAGAHS